MPEDAPPRSTGVSPPAVAPSSGDPRSTSALVTDIATDVQLIVKKEIELARQELKESAAKMGVAAGAGGAAAVLLLFVVGFLGVAAGRALENVLQPWAAWLVVAGIFLALVIIAVLVAVMSARSAQPPVDRTKRSIEENKQWVTQQLRR